MYYILISLHIVNKDRAGQWLSGKQEPGWIPKQGDRNRMLIPDGCRGPPDKIAGSNRIFLSFSEVLLRGEGFVMSDGYDCEVFSARRAGNAVAVRRGSEVLAGRMCVGGR